MLSGIQGQSGPNVSEMWQKLAKKADADGNGTISKDELTTASKNSGKSSDTDVSEAFKLFDSDEDGQITESEFSTQASSMRGPKGPGGPGGPPPMKPQELFKSADSDEDGTVTKDELKTAMSENGEVDETQFEEFFAKLDEDEDGSVTESEFTTAMEKLEEERKTQQPPPPDASANMQKLVDQLPKTESYDSTGETRQKLLRSVLNLSA